MKISEKILPLVGNLLNSDIDFINGILCILWHFSFFFFFFIINFGQGSLLCNIPTIRVSMSYILFLNNSSSPLYLNV